MKISYQWLRELADFDASPRDLAKALTMAGLAVDSVDEAGPDHILDFDLTSNRPDALSHLGIAREIAAIYRSSLKPIPTELAETDRPASAETSVEIREADLCPRYVARLIVDVRVGPSPRWMVERLERLGQRSINNVADITNWVLWEMGQPLHAFDWDTLAERRIVVRRAGPGEKMKTLDGADRELDDRMLVIADARRAVALAGIMGGAETEISLRTGKVLLESAYFQPRNIRSTARSLGMSTEASHRFERGADIEMAGLASARAARLIAEHAGGKVLRGSVDAYPGNAGNRGAIRLRRARMVRLLGFELDMDEAAAILQSLNFLVQPASPEELSATPPSYRVDIGREEDLVEEVGRIAGYDRIPTTLPMGSGSGEYLPEADRRQSLRRTLTGRGFDEAITFSFVSETADQIFATPGENSVRLLHPIDETRAVMRRSLLPGMVESIAKNLHQGVKNVRLFEIGKCFAQGEDGGPPQEREWLAFGAAGAVDELDWRAPRSAYDFFHLKGLTESLFDVVRVDRPPSSPSGALFLHPGRSLQWANAGRWLARMGELHPSVAASFKFRQPVLVGELRLQEMLGLPESPVRYAPLPKFPTVTRDLSFVVDTDRSYAELESAIRRLGIPEIKEVRLFDLYAGGHLPAGKRSLSITIRLRSDERTLKESEIEASLSKVIDLIGRDLGGELRK